MGNYIKNSARILYNYVLSLVLFAVFVYIFLSISGDKFGALLPIYSFVIFLLAFLLIFSETKKLAIKEKKPQYELHPYPFKGFVYGLIGFLPMIVLEVVSVFISFGNEVGDNLKHIAVNSIMGPLFFIIKLFGESVLGYIAASLAIPVVAMLGYMAGYYGINIIKSIRKKDDKPETRAFEKSPWNPNNKTGASPKKKKRPAPKV